jgi:SM-20-related protein
MVQSPDRADRFAHAASQLADTGFFYQHNFFAPETGEAMRAEAVARFEEGDFQAARVGAGNDRVLAPSVRRDWIHWLDPTSLTTAQQAVAVELEGLRLAINSTTFLGLFEWEGHLAIYPPGAFYTRHVDVFRTNRERKVTFIFYLNPAWQPGDGGELRVYADETTSTDYFDVEPRSGTLILFFSEDCHHEVLLSNCDRAAFSGWFRVRTKPRDSRR